MTNLSEPFATDEFKVFEPLGQGAESVVFKAEHLGNPVALKVMRPVQTSHLEGAVQRFKREAACVARFKHPTILPIFDVGERNGSPYLIMGLADGEPLSKRIKSQEKLEASELLFIA